MKVTITPDFQEQYAKLFSDLQAIINDQFEVKNLATYFKALDYIQEKDLGYSWKFLRVPLEEGTFDVDMSTRAITVPPEFVTHGLGVKGDANAEIVWFKVSRWYDTMDLYQQECYVQWQNAKTSGNSPTVFKDAVEDFVYYGWVITDDMTSQSGNLDFALRFFTIDRTGSEAKISYSISTQKATCAIKNTLSLDVLNAIVDPDLENLIRTRPIYSGVINSMDGAAPSIQTNLDDSHEYNLLTSGALYEKYKAEYPEGVYEFAVSAISPDEELDDDGEIVNGWIRYRWYKGSELQNDITLEGHPQASRDKFVATVAGTYFAQIGNETTGSGTRWVNSNTVVIPAAKEIKHDKNVVYPTRAFSVDPEGVHKDRYQDIEFAILGADGKAPNGTVKYNWTLHDLKTNEVVKTLGEEDGVDGGVYVPEVDVEGKVSCVAVNHKNNTQSAPVETEYACVIRAYPRKPTSVTATWNGSDLVCTPVFEGPSANHADEYKYQWFRTFTPASTGTPTAGNVTQAEGGMAASFKPQMQKPANGENRYEFYCNVKHTVFGDVTGFSATGPAVDSNKIVLTIDAAGTVKMVDQ